MKKFLALLLCCLMTYGISFAEEETVEPRPYYEMPKIEFEMKDDLALMDSMTKYESEGYCFTYDRKNKPLIVFVFTLTPLEEDNTMMTLMTRVAFQGDKRLEWGFIDYDVFVQDPNTNEKWTDPELTNGFRIPSDVINNTAVGESKQVSMVLMLDNLEDDVTVDMSYYGVDNFTVTIPSDAFLEPYAQ